MNDDGSMARLLDLKQFCKKHDINMASIEDLIRWRVRNDPIVKRKYKTILKTEVAGEFHFYCYMNIVDGIEHFALVKGEIEENQETLVRVQKLDYIADIFRGKLEGKEVQGNNYIERTLIEINAHKKGVLVILKDNDTLYESIKKNKEQIQQFREYGVGAQILRDLGVRNMILLSKSKRAIIGLEGFDLKVKGHKNI